MKKLLVIPERFSLTILKMSYMLCNIGKLIKNHSKLSRVWAFQNTPFIDPVINTCSSEKVKAYVQTRTHTHTHTHTHAISVKRKLRAH